jgi:hypothetical protein
VDPSPPGRCIQSLCSFALQTIGWQCKELQGPLIAAGDALLQLRCFMGPKGLQRQSRWRLTRRQQLAVAHGAVLAVTAYQGYRLREPIWEGLRCVVKWTWNSLAGERCLAEASLKVFAAVQTANQLRQVLQHRDGTANFTKKFSRQDFRDVFTFRFSTDERRGEQRDYRGLPRWATGPEVPPTIALLRTHLDPHLRRLEQILAPGPGPRSKELFDLVLAIIHAAMELRLATPPDVVTSSLGTLLCRVFRCQHEDDQVRPQVARCPTCFLLAQAALWFAEALDPSEIRTLTDMKIAVEKIRDACSTRFENCHGKEQRSALDRLNDRDV